MMNDDDFKHEPRCSHVFVDRFTRVDGARVYVCEKCGLNKMTRPTFDSFHLRPCRLAPAGWRCTRGGGHTGPCAAEEVPILWNHDPEKATALSPEEIARFFGVLPKPDMLRPGASMLANWIDQHNSFVTWAASRGSQVDPSMALPSKTPEEHDRDTLRRLDGAKWVRLETADGKVTWLPASPEDQALLEAFRAARNGPKPEPMAEWTPGVKYEPGQIVRVADAPRKKGPTVLERIRAWFNF